LTLFITIVSFVLVFAVIVLAHELGHFTAAKLSHVKVEEFGLGYPPRLWGVRRGETLYSINALPLGGFTKMSGEEDPTAPGSLASKSRLTRVVVLAAGAIVNAVLPILLFSIAFMVPHTLVTGTVVVEQVAAGSPAALAGIQVGDTILSVNGHTITSVADMGLYTQLDLGRSMSVEIKHADGTLATISETPRWKPPAGEGATGVQVGYAGDPVIARVSEPFWRAIPDGLVQTWQTLVLFKNGILGLIFKAQGLQVTGPVGIAQLTGEAAQAGVSPLLQFAGFLSLNLAIINILPLPALDGGRIVFVLIEWMRRGKRISPRTEGFVHMIGFVLLIALALAVTYQDIARIITSGGAAP
jgi:regulator of sigma E protease